MFNSNNKFDNNKLWILLNKIRTTQKALLDTSLYSEPLITSIQSLNGCMALLTVGEREKKYKTKAKIQGQTLKLIENTFLHRMSLKLCFL